MPSGYVFGRGSNVLDYWLTKAEGFSVRSGGGRVGVVRAVVVDPLHGKTTALIVRTPLLRRRRVVLAGAIEAVDPDERVLELEPAVRPARASRLVALRRWSDEIDRRFDAAGGWLRPRLRAWSLAAWASVRRHARDLQGAYVQRRRTQREARPGVRSRARGGPWGGAAASRPSRRRP